jgi:hypothetical protein
MSNCILWSYDARQAAKYGKPLTPEEWIILRVSDPLIHDEFQFSERYNKISFSSTLRDGAKGCRFKLIDYTIHPERWLPLILPMTDDEEDRAYIEAERIEGRPYDFIGLGSLSDLPITLPPAKNGYWCSESLGTVIKAAYQWGYSFRPDHYHPVSLYFATVRYQLGINNF